MARYVKLTVNNNTSIKLLLDKSNIINGYYENEPPQAIETSDFWACDEYWYSFIGTRGDVTYKIEGKDIKIKFSWEHPHGTAKSSYQIEFIDDKGKDIIGYDITGSFEGHSQDVTFNLYLK